MVSVPIVVGGAATRSGCPCVLSPKTTNSPLGRGLVTPRPLLEKWLTEQNSHRGWRFYCGEVEEEVYEGSAPSPSLALRVAHRRCRWIPPQVATCRFEGSAPWEATVSLQYHQVGTRHEADDDNDSDKNAKVVVVTLAEVEVTVRWEAASYSSRDRTVTCRVPLDAETLSSVQEWDELEEKEKGEEGTRPRLQVVVSSDGRFLSCLLPHLAPSKTSVLQWTLKKQRRDALPKAPPPPLPSYLLQTRASPPSSPAAAAAAGLRRSLSSGGGGGSKLDEAPSEGTFLPPVPTQPQLVFLPEHHDDEDENQPCISCLCPAAITTMTLSSATSTANASTPSSSSNSNNNNNKRAPVCILLAGCTDGSILSIRYHRRRLDVPNVDARTLVSLLLAPTTATPTTALSDHAILQMSFCPTERLLAVIRQDGVVNVYSTTATATGESGLFLEQEEDDEDDDDDDDEDEENEGLDNGEEEEEEEDSAEDHGSVSTPTAAHDTLSVGGASPASASGASPSVLFRRKMGAFSPQHLRPRRLLSPSGGGSPSLPFSSGSAARSAADALMTRVLPPPVPTGKNGRGSFAGTPPPPPPPPASSPLSSPLFLRRSSSGVSNSSHGRGRRQRANHNKATNDNDKNGMAHLFLQLRFLLTLDARRRGRRLGLRRRRLQPQHGIVPVSPSSGGSVGPTIGTRTTPRFAHGEWIAPHTLLLLTRRCRSVSLGSKKEDENVIAQVWSIVACPDDEEEEGGRFLDASFEGHVLATLRIMADDLWQKEDLGTFRMAGGTMNGGAPSFAHADGHSDTLSIVSAVVSKRKRRRDKGRAAYTLRPFVCLWNWRCNVTGFTLVAADGAGSSAEEEEDDDDDDEKKQQQEAQETTNETTAPLSTLTWSRSRDGGRCLVHTHLVPNCRLQKHVYEIAVLSPLSCGTRGSLEESTPLLLTCRSVQFPLVSMPTENEDQMVKWSESIIPPSYTASHGPATMAAMGRRHGRSIAVASPRGLCLLDMSRIATTLSSTTGGRPSPCVVGKKCASESTTTTTTATKTLSNSIHELTSSIKPVAAAVVSGSNVNGGLRNRVIKWRLFATEAEERSFRVVSMAWWERSLEEGESSEDLLLAVVHYIRGGRLWSEEDHADQLYLVCWSRRRLGMGPDQLLMDSVGEADSSSADRRRGIALPRLMEPGCALSILADPTSSERALAMISCANSGGGISYMIYQVETDLTTTATTARKNPPFLRVLARLSSAGRYLTTSSKGTAFLAGGSFCFRLRQLTENGIDSDEIVATLAVSRGDGGLDAVAVTPAGPLVTGRVVGGSQEEEEEEEAPSQLVSFWLSDATRPTVPEAASSLVAHCFVWSLHWTNGNVYAWSVPYVASNGGGGGSPKTMASRRDSATGFAALHCSFHGLLLPPQPVSPLPIPGVEARNIVLLRRDVLGSCCLLGESSSTLMNGASTIEGDIGLGPLCGCNFGCVLYAGQGSWHANKRVSIYGLGEGVVSSPAFTSSLFVSALTAAAETCGTTTMTMTSSRRKSNAKPSVDALVSRSHAKHMLVTRFNTDAVIMALRVLCLRTVELLSSVIESGLQDSSRYGLSEGKLLGAFADALLREVVWIARVGLSRLQFVALFLSIGRQMEPHHFYYLFPLPGGQRVEDLFAAALECGSVSVAALALPLFSCKEEAHGECCRLLRHCLQVVHHSPGGGGEQEDWAAAVLAQLYRYGLKLQEAKAAERGRQAVPVAAAPPPPPAPSSAPTPLTAAAAAAAVEQDESSKPGVSVGTIAKLLSPSTWGSKKKATLESDETAIRLAASSFILSGFEEHYTLDESGSGVGESRLLRDGDDDDDDEAVEVPLQQGGGPVSLPVQATLVAASPSPPLGGVLDTVGGIVGSYLAMLVFEVRENGWRHAGKVAQMIGTEGLLRCTEADTKQVLNVLTELSEEQVARVLGVVDDKGDAAAAVGEKDTSQGILNALLQLMADCEGQLPMEQAKLLFFLMLSVLKTCPGSVQDDLLLLLLAQWAVMWVVVGRLDGSLDLLLLGGGTLVEEEFLEAWESSPLGRAHVELLQRHQQLS